MSRIHATWVVKTIEGQIKGPYPTEVLLRMIGEGVFTGDELISKLPDGQWTLISKEPDFYDKLLEALEAVVTLNPKKVHKMEAETEIVQVKSTKDSKSIPAKEESNEFSQINFSLKREELLNQKVNNWVPTSIPARNTPNSDKLISNNSIIELSRLSEMETRELWLIRHIPFVSVLFIILIGGVALWPGDHKANNKIHLIMPGPTNSTMSESQIKQNLNEALFLIEQDTFENYLSAENKLVSLVEGAPTNIEVRALLCTVYRELWPYAAQDSQDIKTISTVTQSAKSLNIVSPLGQVCETVKLLTTGRFREARSTVESALDSTEAFSLLPVMYEYKAEMLQSDRDITNAVPYFDKSIKMWNKWLHPQVKLAELYYEKQNFAESANLLQLVLKANPNHREAKYLSGIVDFKGFKNTDSALTNLSAAADMKTRIPPKTEALGLFVLAEIYVTRNEKTKALTLAEKSFAINSTNNEVRQLIIQLGGSDKLLNVRNQNNDLLFLGDQYIRQGDYLAAQAEFKAAFELDPKNGTAALKAAKSLWQLNQSYEAIEWLKKATHAEPNLISAYVLQADYMSQRYDFTGALSSLTNALKISANNYEVLRGLAWLDFRKNNMVGAIDYATRATKIYDGDVESYILLSKANGALAQYIVPLNKHELDRKEKAVKDSIRFATRAVEIDSTNAEAQIIYAKTIASINGVDAGIRYLTELIGRYSYTLDYQIALAEIYKSEDRWSQSRTIYEKIVGSDAKNKAGWLGLGESFKALGLNDKALKAFLQAAILDPTDGEALFQAGKLYLETGRFDEAIQQFRRVQRLNPHFPRTNYFIGKAAFSSGDFNSAMEAARAEKKLNPNIADSYILAAEINAAKKQFQDCANEYSQAIKLRSQGAEIYVKSAQCYRQAGALDIAEDMLALAASRESGYPELYREQGAIYEIKGDARSAATAYNKYLGLSPNALDRVEITNRVNRLGN